jgi:hypothetical protein
MDKYTDDSGRFNSSEIIFFIVSNGIVGDLSKHD